MDSYLFFFLAVFSSFIFTYAYRYYAIRKSIIDIPNDRSSHTIPTPRGGGIAVALVWFIGLVYFFINNQLESSLFYSLLCGLPLTLVGLIDDIYSLRPLIRFIVQAVSSMMALFFLKGLQFISFPFGSIDYLYVLSFIAFVGIIWSINLFNFLDGIDGYIGSEVVFIGLSIYYFTGDVVGILLAASTLGFLILNWPKAKIFMGDVGSTLIGFTVAVLAIYHQNNSICSLWIWLILTSVFWFDATVTLIRRIINREKLSEAHKKHAFQRIVQFGFSHQKTTLWMLLINLVGFIFATFAFYFSNLAWLFLACDLIVLYRFLRYVDNRRPFEKRR